MQVRRCKDDEIVRLTRYPDVPTSLAEVQEINSPMISTITPANTRAFCFSWFLHLCLYSIQHLREIEYPFIGDYCTNSGTKEVFATSMSPLSVSLSAGLTGRVHVLSDITG